MSDVVNGWWRRPSVGGLVAAFSPERVFKEPLFWSAGVAPWCLIAFSQLALVYWTAPYVREAILRSLPPDATATGLPLERVLALTLRARYVGAVLMPFIFTTLWSALVFLGVGATGRVVSYRHIWTASSCAYVVLLGKDVFAAVITAIRGISAITGGKDLEVSVGLGMFLSDYSIAARTAIDSVNVFDLWFVGLVGYAIETTGTVTRRQAVSVVGASWLVLVAFRVALATMLPS